METLAENLRKLSVTSLVSLWFDMRYGVGVNRWHQELLKEITGIFGELGFNVKRFSSRDSDYDEEKSAVSDIRVVADGCKFFGGPHWRACVFFTLSSGASVTFLSDEVLSDAAGVDWEVFLNSPRYTLSDLTPTEIISDGNPR